MSDQADGLRKAMAAESPDGAMRAARKIIGRSYPAPGADEVIAQIIREETAAPEMLEALKAALVMMDRGGEPRKWEESLTWRANDELARKMIVEAIAKAKGGE